jgi:hypothetical protein
MTLTRVFRLNEYLKVFNNYKGFISIYNSNVVDNKNYKPFKLINPDVPICKTAELYFLATINKDLEETPYRMGVSEMGTHGVWRRRDKKYMTSGGEVRNPDAMEMVWMLLEGVNSECLGDDTIELYDDFEDSLL